MGKSVWIYLLFLSADKSAACQTFILNYPQIILNLSLKEQIFLAFCVYPQISLYLLAVSFKERFNLIIYFYKQNCIKENVLAV